MDLSKLPKLSDTQANTPPPSSNSPENSTPNPDPRFAQNFAAPQPGIGADVWFNTCVGLLVVYLGRTFLSYLSARAQGKPFPTGFFWPDGHEETYFELLGFTALCDMGTVLFGVVVLMEAATKAIMGIAGRVPTAITGFVLSLAVAVTLFNIYVCIRQLMFGDPQIILVLAVAYGGYIIFDLMTIYRYRAVKVT